MFLLIDNTNNLNKAFMTPKILKLLDNFNISYQIITKKQELMKIINTKINIKGIILSGGPTCISDPCNYNNISKNIISMNIFKNTPILGICLGFQIMCDIYGSTISRLNKKNTGLSEIIIDNTFLLTKTMPNISKVFYSHHDCVISPPIGFNILKYNDMIIGIENIKLKRFGFQFHPEGSLNGCIIIKNFIKYCYLD